VRDGATEMSQGAVSGLQDGKPSGPAHMLTILCTVSSP